MTLEDITNTMQQRVSEKGAIDGKVVKFDFSDDGVIRIDGTGSEPKVDNEDAAADCTIKVSKEDFIEIAEGRQDAQMAFMMGKLSVDGDMTIAMQLGQILG
ncbi:MAG: SCP2 sterol-binding domain-containing protein [Rhodothalassiaceae bacterium]